MGGRGRKSTRQGAGGGAALQGALGLGDGDRKWEGKPRFTNRQDTVGRAGTKSARSGKLLLNDTATPHILSLGSASHGLLI